MSEQMIKLKGPDTVGRDNNIIISKSSLESQLKPDLSKLKEGDEVWVKMRIRDLNIWSNSLKDLIAHFPKEEKEKDVVEQADEAIINLSKKLDEIVNKEMEKPME
jgi:hypothetical protein